MRRSSKAARIRSTSIKSTPTLIIMDSKVTSLTIRCQLPVSTILQLTGIGQSRKFPAKESKIVISRILSFLLLLVIVNVPNPAAAQKGTIKIAVQAPLSGEQAALGEHVKLGAQ